jgi:O-6-methylguanine DNA methyltransferase
MAKVQRYISKPSGGLRLALDMRGTPFQRRVWEKLKAVPVGCTVSYRELAKWVSPVANARAVATACAANPIALAIPCHRVVRSNGDLAGYRWGVERKSELLRREAME